jgi:peroxiredoxin
MSRVLIALSLFAALVIPAFAAEPAPASKVAIGEQAPTFKIKDAAGKVIDLADLTAKGPVLVRLTCGCSGCDKELSYFKEINEAYKDQGLTSLLIFKEPDDKVAKYAVEKKLSSMLYAVDSKGESWKTFQTTSMPTNFLIAKGGKISSIAAGCDPSGLLANKVSKQAANVVGAKTVDVQKKVDSKAADTKTESKKTEEKKADEKPAK